VTAVHEARQRHPIGCYLALDAARLPFSCGAFAAVVFLDLLEHVPDARRMLSEVARILAPGGTLHAYVPLEAQPASLYQVLEHSQRWPIHRWKRDHVGHVHRYDDAQVLRLVWNAGLEVRWLAYSFHPIGQLHDLVDYWQRERVAGGPGWLPLPAVRALARAVFVVTWRLAYLEDRIYSGRVLASGLHLTAVKP
jgi:SAM-dependent methyltransferase